MNIDTREIFNFSIPIKLTGGYTGNDNIGENDKNIKQNDIDENDFDQLKMKVSEINETVNELTKTVHGIMANLNHNNNKNNINEQEESINQDITNHMNPESNLVDERNLIEQFDNSHNKNIYAENLKRLNKIKEIEGAIETPQNNYKDKDNDKYKCTTDDTDDSCIIM
jgi:hypothetical protein